MLTRRMRVKACIDPPWQSAYEPPRDVLRRAAAAERLFVRQRPWFPAVAVVIPVALVAMLGLQVLQLGLDVPLALGIAHLIVQSTLMFGWIGLSVTAGRRMRRVYREVGDARACFACGYPLDGLGGDAICPECGDGGPTSSDA